MKALFYPDYGRLEMADRPPPQILESSDILLRVLACGISGSELETFQKRSPRRTPPLIMGHEFCGMVTETGSLVTRFNIGDYVISHSLLACGECSFCIAGHTNLCRNAEVLGMQRNGAFAEEIVVPEKCLIHIPGKIDPRAACMTEPVANAVHIVRLLQEAPEEPEIVLVMGAGAVGLLTIQVLKALTKAAVIVVDIDEQRLSTAKRLGADHGINPAKTDLKKFVALFDLLGGIGAAIDAEGNFVTMAQALNSIKAGGTLILAGPAENNIAMLSYNIVLQEKKVIGAYAATQKDLETAADMIAHSIIDVFSWVTYYPLDEGARAFDDMASGHYVKAVIYPIQ